MEKVTRKFANYIFIIIQFITITALAIANKINNVGEVLFVTSLFIGYIFLGKKYSFYVSNYIHICLGIVVIVHSFAGKYLNLYIESVYFDKYLHVFGTYAVTLFFYSIFKNIMGISFISKISNFLYVILLGVSIGAIFEILEFIVDITISPNISNQQGLLDTNLDMIANLIGSLIAAFHITIIGIKLQLIESEKNT